MKLKELYESNSRAYDAELYIKQFNEDDNHEANLLLGDLSMTKIPIQIDGSEFTNYEFSDNNLSTFENFPPVAKRIGCNRNKFESLHNIHKYIKEMSVFSTLSFFENPIKSHVLGLLKIKNLKEVILYGTGDDKKLMDVETIINKYLPEGDLLKCQEELIDAGLDDFAQL